MCADHRARTFPVDIQIADEESIASLLDLLPIVRVNRACQTVLSVVRQLERVIEVFRLRDRQHRAENLFLKYASASVYVRYNGRLKEISFSRCLATARDQAAFLLALLDIPCDAFLR